MAESREEKDKRRLILEAAITVFSQYGFHQTKVEDVAVAAGIGKGTIYEYFSSKQELFEEMFRECVLLYGERMQKDLAAEETIRRKIVRLIQLHLEFTQKHKDLAKVAFGDHSWISQDLKNWMISMRRQKIAQLKAMIEEGIKRGEFRAVNPEAAGFILAGTLSALWFPDEFSDQVVFDRLVDSLHDILLYGLSAE
ncbi:MAG: TetR/AcrR family transcriptional regulator [Firmicutes bacterium]|nr:TetR/AcrR family transcriptional regulator [Bacillota bacterium]